MQRIIKHDAVRRVASEEAAPRVALDPPQREPGVRVLRAGGRVHALEVTCACGETTLIELEYQDD